MSKTMKDVEKGMVPALRFPEFREAGEWTETPLDKCLNYLQPTPYLVSSTVYDDKYPIPVLTAGKTFILGYTNEEDGIFDDNLPVIIFDDFTTASKFVDFPFKAKSSAMKILLAKQSANIKFIFESMQMIRYEVGVHERHWISIFSKLPVVLPPQQKEQQKIADCLSSLDEQIAAQADKIDALKTHKKGLMQQLFPREGETVPRLRFPEFWKAGEWKIKRAKLLFSNRVEPGEEGLPIYSVTMNEGLAKRESLERKIANISQASGNKKAQRHDIVYNMMRMWQGASGVAVEDCMVSPAYVVLAPTDNICADFYGYFLKLPQSLQVLTAHSQGLTKDRLRLYFKDFGQIRLPCPQLEEQQKIADCLFSIDALITAHTEKLEALKSHKKGLMQQLFPNPEAMGA